MTGVLNIQLEEFYLNLIYELPTDSKISIFFLGGGFFKTRCSKN